MIYYFSYNYSIDKGTNYLEYRLKNRLIVYVTKEPCCYYNLKNVHVAAKIDDYLVSISPRGRYVVIE